MRVRLEWGERETKGERVECERLGQERGERVELEWDEREREE